MDGFEIVDGRANHVDQLVSIHLLAFPDFFLSKLGAFFLRVYYKSIVQSNDGISLVLIDKSGNVIGFCVGTQQSLGFHSRLIKNNLLKFIIAGLVIVAVNPGGIQRLIKNLNKKSTSLDNGMYSEVLSIAVNPDYKAMGFGKLLLTSFEEMALSKGCSEVSLTTDYYENSRILDFYFKCGYKVMATFYAYPKRKMYRLIKRIN
jgi:ribosomal protein S18 acetylase RimI-like enzyme